MNKQLSQCCGAGKFPRRVHLFSIDYCCVRCGKPFEPVMKELAEEEISIKCCDAENGEFGKKHKCQKINPDDTLGEFTPKYHQDQLEKVGYGNPQPPIKENWESNFDDKIGNQLLIGDRTLKDFIPETYNEIKSFIKDLLHKSVEEERERIMKEIKEHAEPYDRAKWFNMVSVDMISKIVKKLSSK